MVGKKRWRDLTMGQRAGIVVLGGVQLGLLLAALSDLWRRPATAINGRKTVWTAVACVNFIGPIAYFLVGRKR